MDNGKVTERMTELDLKYNINYQHSLNKFKNCMDCQLEKEAIEEMDLNIIKLNKFLHEALLIQNNLID